ncbi:MAG: flippase-like domain-containing protein [Clostridiales bacterium]|nr:flippase-like domain-containing protein [Clostridiales bacterium]
MKPRTKKILNFAFIFGTLAVVLLVGFNGQEMSGAIAALKSIGPEWIVLCLLAWASYLLFDSLSLHHFLKTQGQSISLASSIFVSLSGMYYSNITPGATGGQPMQVYYLKKRSVPIGIGTSALTVKLFAFQFMLAVLGTVLWIAYREYIALQLGNNIWILIIGYVYNVIVVAFTVLMATNKRLVRFVVLLFIKAGAKLRLIKDPSATQARWEDVIDTFHNSVMMIARRPMDLVVQLLLATVQILSLMAVTFFIYHAFRLTGSDYGQITALGVMLYTSAAYTPLPGASGAQEGVFALYFSQVFPDGIRLMALLLWRFFTYYITLIVGAIVSVANGFRSGKKKPAQD